MIKYILLIFFLGLVLVAGISGQELPEKEIFRVEYKNLFKNPKLYNSQKIRATAFYTMSFESSWLTLSGPQKSSDPNFRDEGFANIQFDKSWRENSGAGALKRFDKAAKRHQKEGTLKRTIKITFVGTFEYSYYRGDKSRPVYTVTILYIE